MKTLNRNLIIEAAEKVKPGTIARICYKTELPVKAEWKKQGYKMYKIVETSARLGVNYGNIASVKARKELEENKPQIKRTNNYEWIIKNKVRHNTNTDKDYLYIALFNKGDNTKTKYIVESPSMGTIDLGRELDSLYNHILIDSYFKNKYQSPEVKNISFDNIIRINSIGDKIKF